MNELNNCLKKFSLSYTDTIDINDFYGKETDINNIEINYDNCISLYNLICAFNKMHIAFKKEYDKLEKLDLGKDVNVLSFTKIEDRLRVLEMILYKPTLIDQNYAYLYLRELNGVIKPFITNDMGSIHNDNGFYRNSIKLDHNKVRKYLDLFEKYELLFKLYKYLENRLIFTDGTNTLLTKIESEKGKFLDNMKSFRVRMDANYYMKPNSHIDIFVDLGEEISPSISGSSIVVNDKSINFDKEMCLNILKNVYINGKYLEKESYRKNEIDDNKVKVLINNL